LGAGVSTFSALFFSGKVLGLDSSFAALTSGLLIFDDSSLTEPKISSGV